MTRVSSNKTRQALLVLDDTFDPDNIPERLSLFDADGNQLDFSPAHVVPPGGDVGQVLGKTGVGDYAIAWVDAGGGAMVPVGGTTGQVLAKASDDDADVEWVDSGGGSSGFQGAWVAQAYSSDSIVRHANALWVASADAGSDDIPGTTEVVSFQDTQGDYGAPFDHVRLTTDEQDWVAANGIANSAFLFFDVITAGDLTIDHNDGAVYHGWMNLYIGSTGVRFSPNPGTSDWTGFLGVGRYFVLIVRDGGVDNTGTIQIILDTAEISFGGVNPWDLMLQGVAP